ncbi:hypothetical protein EGR_06535 [Echinococcus granulosus]|uniref:Uncharacterized protein n=1 Tax=Echinococcus granulosus TaxID=6210 RepID=W6UAZ3_ECHGR|nr:hypothetical protein EGR_06535 [Echinococcus granulosus]EUB58548.1 hypothetical protein EGR_06535 [Echinococcus granulosus]
MKWVFSRWGMHCIVLYCCIFNEINFINLEGVTAQSSLEFKVFDLNDLMTSTACLTARALQSSQVVGVQANYLLVLYEELNDGNSLSQIIFGRKLLLRLKTLLFILNYSFHGGLVINSRTQINIGKFKRSDAPPFSSLSHLCVKKKYGLDFGSLRGIFIRP